MLHLSFTFISPHFGAASLMRRKLLTLMEIFDGALSRGGYSWATRVIRGRYTRYGS